MDDSESAIEQAKLAAMKELAYGASHEINNPLANISAQTQALLRLETDPERRRALAAIHAQAMRAHEMISDLMLFARPPRIDLAPVDLIELIQRAIAELSDDAEARGVRIGFSPTDHSVICQGDATQLTIAVKALLQNALEAIGREGQIDVACHQRTTHPPLPETVPSPCAEIFIEDDGPGIPPEIRPRIFDPFYSGRDAGRGLGFGLSKAWRIITMHQGTIQIDGPNLQGARFVILLPLNNGATESSPLPRHSC